MNSRPFNSICLSNHSHIKFIETPTDYYNLLRNHLKTANQRIILSALYLGVGDLEFQIWDDIEWALSHKSELVVTLLFDYCRYFRKQKKQEEYEIRLQRLLSSYPNRLKLFLFEMIPFSPSPLSSLFPPPIWIRELLGVYHCKYCVFDDNCVLTGANLSHEYFTSRQDRYLFIPESKDLARFLQSFSDNLDPLCHKVTCDSNHNNNVLKVIPPSRKDKISVSGSLSPNPNMSSLLDLLGEEEMRLVPLVQMFPHDIRHEEETLLSLLSIPCCCLSWSDVTISSPYPSFLKSFTSALAQNRDRYRSVDPGQREIITASVRTHGFAGSKGVKQLIPVMHWEALRESLHPSSPLRVLEFDREGWTFHSKGIWCFGETNNKPVSVTYIGSSNLGDRSWRRDFELGFLLLAKGDRHKDLLWKEKETIKTFCKVNNLNNNKSQMFPRLLMKMFRSFL